MVHLLFDKYIGKIRSVNRGMAVGAAGILVKPGVESGLHRVATVAQIGYILESQHVAVG